MRHIDRIRQVVEDAGHGVDGTVYEAVRRLFLACAAEPALLREVKREAPEYGRREHLVCVDGDGAPARVPVEVVEDWRRFCRVRPGFRTWFQQGAVGAAGEPALLPARWLCHLAGMRHRSVQLFIDHPLMDGYTLVQVRGTGKLQYPACFDVPAAGHVVGLQSVEAALYAELNEELGLAASDLEKVEPIGSYDSFAVNGLTRFRDCELRLVFAGRVRSAGLLHARFLDGEVAALAVCAVPEVQALVSAFPDRVASGLAESLPLYLAHRRG